MSDCIGYRTKNVHWICTYRSIEKVQEVPGAFLLYFEPDCFHLIPKKGLTKDQSQQISQMLSSPALRIL
jgi:YcxB-like protein